MVGFNPSYFSAKGEGKKQVVGRETKAHPVENISYYDAIDFCIQLSNHEMLKPVYESANNVVTLLPGDGYRLPTGAEWEYACRAGTNTPWCHGEHENALQAVACFSANSAGHTHAVGQLGSNPFGLYDVHGNVWEWCQDWHDGQPYSQSGPSPTEDPQGPAAGSVRVLRGGNWIHEPAHCRSALRVAFNGGVRGHHYGFRVALGVVGGRSVRRP